MTSPSTTKFIVSAISAILGLLAAGSASATPVTFAQVTEHVANGPGNVNIDWNVSGGVGSLTTHTASDAVDFIYKSYDGMLPAALLGTQSANLTISAKTTANATSFSGFDFQPFDQAITLVFTRATPLVVLGTPLSNLLTVTITPRTANRPSFVGNDGSTTTHSMALVSDTTHETITYTSDFIDFSHTIERDLALSFSAVNPGLSIAANNFFAGFQADFTGTFDSDPAPSTIEVPEPGSLLILAAGIGGIAVLVRRRSQPV